LTDCHKSLFILFEVFRSFSAALNGLTTLQQLTKYAHERITSLLRRRSTILAAADHLQPIMKMVFLSLLGLLLAPTTALKIVMAPDASAYAIADETRTLFKSGTNSVAVFVDGAWKSEKDRTLNLTAYDLVDGDDPVIGAYEGVEMTWATDTGTTVVTRAVAAAAAAVFAISFPDGAARTSPYGHNGESHESVLANWPCFVSAFGAGRLSWGGPFVRPSPGAATTGPMGGPLVVFDGATAAVASAYSSFKASSAGPGKTWDGAPAVWAPGTAGTVETIPANFSHEFLVSVGDTGSITAAVADWGALIRRKQGATPYDDVTLQKVGYQTDNGAFYCFCGGGDCSQTLIDKGAELRDHGAPMGYLSFQGAGASSGRGQAAPWCVSTWGVDGGLGTQYPLSVGELSRAFDAPVQLYAPYFCPGSDYFNDTSPWTAVVSNTSREGCRDYAFEDVVAGLPPRRGLGRRRAVPRVQERLARGDRVVLVEDVGRHVPRRGAGRRRRVAATVERGAPRVMQRRRPVPREERVDAVVQPEAVRLVDGELPAPHDGEVAVRRRERLDRRRRVVDDRLPRRPGAAHVPGRELLHAALHERRVARRGGRGQP